MAWGSVELEPEVRDWLERLPTAQFATAAFYVDLLAEQGPLLGEPYSRQLDGKVLGSTWTGRRCVKSRVPFRVPRRRRSAANSRDRYPASSFGTSRMARYAIT